MRKYIGFRAGIPLLLGGMLALGACQEQGPTALDGVGELSDDETPEFAKAGVFDLVQVDRFGLPAINTVFIPSGLKDAFNQTAPADDPATFQSVIDSVIRNRYGGSADLAAALADFVTPDVQPFNTAQPAGFPNGRRLHDDVVTTELMLLFGDNAALNDDHVDANDRPFLGAFPYLAPPFDE